MIALYKASTSKGWHMDIMHPVLRLLWFENWQKQPSVAWREFLQKFPAGCAAHLNASSSVASSTVQEVRAPKAEMLCTTVMVSCITT